MKYRYIVLKYEFDDATRYVIDAATFADIVKDLLAANYGEAGLAKLNVSVMENLPKSAAVLFGVPRSVFKGVQVSIEKCTHLGGHLCRLSVVCVSGSIKNARKKLIAHLKIANAV